MLELIKRFGLPDFISDFMESYLIAGTIALAIVGVILAFWGYKFVKVMLIIASSGAGAIATNLFLVPLFADKVANISFVSITGIVVLVAALIAALIAYKWPRFIVFLGGAGLGYLVVGHLLTLFLVAKFPDVTFFNSKVGLIIVSAVAALVCALIVSLLFKFLFILLTSLTGSLLTTVSVLSLIFGGGVLYMIIPAIVVLVALTIVAMVCQYLGGRKYQPVYY